MFFLCNIKPSLRAEVGVWKLSCCFASSDFCPHCFNIVFVCGICQNITDDCVLNNVQIHKLFHRKPHSPSDLFEHISVDKEDNASAQLCGSDEVGLIDFS